MLSELGAVRDPDTDKLAIPGWHLPDLLHTGMPTVGATTRETVLSLAAELLPRTCGRTLKGLLASSRVVGAELLAACKTLGIPSLCTKARLCEFGEEKAVAGCSSIAANSL